MSLDFWQKSSDRLPGLLRRVGTIERKPQESRVAFGYIHLLRDFLPFRMRFGVELASGGNGKLEVFLGNSVGISIVAYPNVRFLHRYDVRDLVSSAVGVVLNTAHPKIGCVAQEGPSVLLKPCPILSRQPILPCRECDIAIDVVLRRCVLESKARRRFRSVGSGLPGKHRAFIPVPLCISPRRFARPGSECNHGTS